MTIGFFQFAQERPPDRTRRHKFAPNVRDKLAGGNNRGLAPGDCDEEDKAEALLQGGLIARPRVINAA